MLRQFYFIYICVYMYIHELYSLLLYMLVKLSAVCRPSATGWTSGNMALSHEVTPVADVTSLQRVNGATEQDNP